MDTFADEAFVGESSTYFQVVASDLIGVMVEGGMTAISVGTAQDYTLEPLVYSLDPDVDPVDPQNIAVVSWYCDVLDPFDPVDSVCQSYRTASGSTLTIEGSRLIDGRTYIITANLQKDSRTATAELQVTIQGVFVPAASILCDPSTVCYKRKEGYTVLESSRVSLHCKCDTCRSSAQYLWTIYIRDYRWPNEWRRLKSTDMLSGRSIGKANLMHIIYCVGIKKISNPSRVGH
ncbi:location of vulva defective 1 [Plakobranchus ocellatus]|uniref:Location of vulva defective 1 n=1 Tax=Plakobranchus ocellatus TaxID=259542 RepID=A0AAV3ZKT5_9GAST|nr:location of vulva defective 1 [Plakobranchus ocellatus]